MMNLLAALENSSFSVWLRGSPSLFAYPAVLTLIVVIDLVLFWRFRRAKWV